MPMEPWRPTHPIESPLRKIRRAEKHIEFINDHIVKWEALDPNGIERHLSTDQAFNEYSIRATYPPVLDIGISLGEFAYQLRSALDQLVFALSVFPSSLKGRDRETAERSTSFPIRRARDDDAIWGCLKYVPEDIRGRAWEAVNLVQPYQRANADHDPLAQLDLMNIRDKHRVLDPVQGALRINKVNIDPRIEIQVGPSVNDGDVFARVPVDLDPEMDFESRISREIQIPISRPPGGIPIRQIGEIYGCVAFDVLPRFLPLFDPIPASVKIPVPPP